ncbi:MAG TPA: hypothetical protein QGI71_08695 [Dehalococcoidia bacterium]|nr:hypothetical protein [Dehalococcoidia bacterium]
MRDRSPRLLGLIEFTTALLSVIAVAALAASVLVPLRMGGGPAIVSAALIGVAGAAGAGVPAAATRSAGPSTHRGHTQPAD